jgi:hypothetical protein
MTTLSPPQRGTPWHVWVVGALALLWNGAGAYTIMMARAGRLPDVGAGKRRRTLAILQLACARAMKERAVLT